MILRLRTNVGVWRIQNLPDDPSLITLDLLHQQIHSTRPNVIFTKPISLDAAGTLPFASNVTGASVSPPLSHGCMLYARVDPETIAESTMDGTNPSNPTSNTPNPTTTITSRTIGADGSIKIIQGESTSTANSKSYRKGMLPLRDMKMQWTLQDYIDMDNQFTFKIAAQKDRWVGDGGVSFDGKSADEFQQYLRLFAFQRCRVGYLYGKFINEEKDTSNSNNSSTTPFRKDTTTDEPPKNLKVMIEAIYEPPQESDPSTPEGYVLLDDPNEDAIDTLAQHLQLERVGWILGHPPRPDAKCPLTAAELIQAAEFQLEAADGVNPTPFVTATVTLRDQDVSLEAFQVSRQCMEMVAEGALEPCDDDDHDNNNDDGASAGGGAYVCKVNETFTAIQEGKEAKQIDNNFFLMTCPVHQHVSDVFALSDFPRANRDFDANKGVPSHDELKKQLSRCSSGGNNTGWTFVDLLSDFHLLMYLMQFLDVQTDIPKICASVVDKENIPLDEGYKIIIASMAGLDGNYD